jgi:hypothetical protein
MRGFATQNLDQLGALTNNTESAELTVLGCARAMLGWGEISWVRNPDLVISD